MDSVRFVPMGSSDLEMPVNAHLVKSIKVEDASSNAHKASL